MFYEISLLVRAFLKTKHTEKMFVIINKYVFGLRKKTMIQNSNRKISLVKIMTKYYNIE